MLDYEQERAIYKIIIKNIREEKDTKLSDILYYKGIELCNVLEYTYIEYRTIDTLTITNKKINLYNEDDLIAFKVLIQLIRNNEELLNDLYGTKKVLIEVY